MTSIMTSIIALLFSAAVMLVGHGLQLTLAPLYANSLGWSDTVIGFMGSTYFGGFVIGCLTIPHLVAQVGHIRVYTVLIALATTALLLLGLVQEPMIWYLARMVTGWSLAGLYMIIESWLNERSPSAQRARVLSVYTIITLIAICAGQLLVGLKMNYLQMILLAAIFLALGTIPVGLTRSPPPSPIPPVSFSLAAVYRASHIAVLGAFAGGLVTAGFWSLGPIMALAQGIAVEDIGLFMSVTILGGAVFQFPLGRLSDQRDRRLVLMLIALTGALVCALSLLITLPENQKMIYLLMFLFGGLTFPLYSLCLAHANDNTDLGIMSIASVILLVHSAGAVIGPMAVALLLKITGLGLFVFSAVILTGFACITGWRLYRHPAERAYYEPWVGIPRTTHEVTEFMEDSEPSTPQ